MPVVLQYLLKLSCSLAVVYFFYYLTLRKITFYTANRWYLLGYSLLSLFLPLLNITEFIEQEQLAGSAIVQAIPAFEQYAPAKAMALNKLPVTYTIWDGFLLLFGLGVMVLLARLVVQYLSYRRIKKSARLLTDDAVKVYEVTGNLIPFSFGNAIFINPQLHSDTELKEIIRHEYVHVKQRHTVDIIWAEMLCLLNWYNPAVWLLRRAIRQNLEFIADNNVLRSGMDKQAYQHLLLKVMGLPQFHIAAPFNFSSLKNRIVMMNKLKSAKAHLVKFLFILPLLAVVLVAFRNVRDGSENAQQASTGTQAKIISISGLVVQKGSYEPLADVLVRETFSGTKVVTDSRGFFTMDIPVPKLPVKTELLYSKEGFGKVESSAEFDSLHSPARMVEVVNLDLLKQDGEVRGYSTLSNLIATGNKEVSVKPTYEEVLNLFEGRKEDWIVTDRFLELSRDSEKPYWVVNGRSFIRTKDGGWGSFDEVIDIVFVDGKRMTGEEINKSIKRSSFTSVSCLGTELAKKKHGINQPVFEIYINTRNAEMDAAAPLSTPRTDTTEPPAANKAFLIHNPTLKGLA